MTYNEYSTRLKYLYPKILDKNILFWNLWNVCYPFEILESYKENYSQYYSTFNEMWVLCWNFNDLKKIDFNIFHNVFDKTYPFVFDDDGSIINIKGIQTDFKYLDDFCLPEKCIKELFYSFDNIYNNLNSNSMLILTGDTPMNIIDIVLDNEGLGFLENNMNNLIVQNEVEAQIKLLIELSKPQNFTYQDRNIYRNKLTLNTYIKK
jgi:hypothetical protein